MQFSTRTLDNNKPIEEEDFSKELILSGVIDRVIFYSEENSYCVANFRFFKEDLTEFYSKQNHTYDDNDYFTNGEGRLVQAGLLDSLERKVTNWKMQQMYKDKIAKRKLGFNDSPSPMYAFSSKWRKMV